MLLTVCNSSVGYLCIFHINHLTLYYLEPTKKFTSLCCLDMLGSIYALTLATPNNPISVGHNDSQLAKKIWERTSVAHINYFCRKLVWVINIIVCCFVLQLIFSVFVESLQEDLEKNPGFGTTLTSP